ncbi:hypothetical protein JW905_17040 [bacterium]|nr:hypothetical protein [candidate division CSSED10-310 bacterium]
MHRRRSIVGVVLVVLGLLAAGRLPALAFTSQTGERVNLAADQVVDDDCYLAGGTIEVDGRVTGDLWAAAQTIRFRGVVDGSLNLVAETIIMEGTVGHAAKAAGKYIEARGDIGGDLMALGSDVDITPDAEVAGDLVIGCGHCTLNGNVGGDVLGGSGQLYIGGRVDGDVKIGADQVNLGSAAVVGGSLDYMSPGEAVLEPGAVVNGGLEHREEAKEDADETGEGGLGLGWKMYMYFSFLLAGTLLIVVWPATMERMVKMLAASPGAGILRGMLALLLVPPLFVVLCITVIGIPLALALLLVYFAALYLATIPVGIWLGSLPLLPWRRVEGRGLMILALVIGLIILTLLDLIPYLSILVSIATLMFGLGSLVMAAKKQV